MTGVAAARDTEPITKPKLLTPVEVVAYLLCHHLLSGEHAVDHDLEITDASRRNRNLRVVAEDGAGYLVKQATSADRVLTLAREAALCARLDQPDVPDALRRHLPRLGRYDAESHLLVTELTAGAESLHAYHHRTGRFPPGLAAAAGYALAALHRAGVGIDLRDDARPMLDQPPWILALHQPRLQMLREISAANVRIVRIIQGFPELGGALDVLREAWRPATLVHNDAKWDNVIVYPRPGSTRRSRVLLVDWELAGRGDPGWDIGSFLSEYLTCWVGSMPVSAEAPPEQLAASARFPLERLQPAMRAGWRSYADGMGLDGGARDAMLERVVRYAAARLIQSAFEQTQQAIEISGNIVLLLQLSLNMLTRPRQAAAALLGIPDGGIAR